MVACTFVIRSIRVAALKARKAKNSMEVTDICLENGVVHQGLAST